MKFFIAFSTVILAAAAAPAPLADELLLANNSSSDPFSTDRQNSGLVGFGAGTRGGQGGASWTVSDPWALRDALNSGSPRIITVRGRIDLSLLFVSSPGVSLPVGPHKTIRGGDRNAEITGGGLQLVNQVHVIIEDIKFTNPISYAPGEWPNGNGGIVSQQPGAYSAIDSVDINESEFVWVNHCEFSDDPWNANNTPENNRRHNGLVTVKRHTSYVTISNSIFRNHNMNLLIGHNDGWTADNGRLKTTLYQNWFQGTNQRNPMVRYGEVHVLNNLFTDVQGYGIGVYIGASVIGERNVFVNTARAWANPVWQQPAQNSNFRNVDNSLVNSSFDSGMGSNVNWDPSRYYSYNSMSVNNVQNYVRSNAGTRF